MSGEQKIVVAADGVTKRFGGVTAVDNLSLAIAEKEFFALLGPSGCGKTTLLRVIAGLLYLAGGLVMAWNVTMTILGHKRNELPIPGSPPALAPAE